MSLDRHRTIVANLLELRPVDPQRCDTRRKRHPVIGGRELECSDCWRARVAEQLADFEQWVRADECHTLAALLLEQGVETRDDEAWTQADDMPLSQWFEERAAQLDPPKVTAAGSVRVDPDEARVVGKILPPVEISEANAPALARIRQAVERALGVDGPGKLLWQHLDERYGPLVVQTPASLADRAQKDNARKR